MTTFNGNFFSRALILFRSKFCGVTNLRMDYINNVLNYFRGKNTRENDNNDLNNRDLTTPNGRNGEMISSNNSNQDFPDVIFKRFFPENSSNEDDYTEGFFSDRGHPFMRSRMMHISSISSYFENIMDEMDRQFRGMMGVSGFSDFNIEDFQDENVNFQNNRELTGDSLRNYYLNTGETAAPETNQLTIRKNDLSNTEPLKFSYKMEKVVYRVNGDGTAEVTQIFKGEDGKEERNVTKFKLK